MRRQRPRSAMGTNLVLAVGGLLVLVVVLVVLLDQRRFNEHVARTEQDLQAVRIGEPIANLAALHGFTQLMTIPIGEYGPAVVTVYRKSIGRKQATGIQWDICLDQHGRVIEIRREGAGTR